MPPIITPLASSLRLRTLRPKYPWTCPTLSDMRPLARLLGRTYSWRLVAALTTPPFIPATFVAYDLRCTIQFQNNSLFPIPSAISCSVPVGSCYIVCCTQNSLRNSIPLPFCIFISPFIVQHVHVCERVVAACHPPPFSSPVSKSDTWRSGASPGRGGVQKGRGAG